MSIFRWRPEEEAAATIIKKEDLKLVMVVAVATKKVVVAATEVVADMEVVVAKVSATNHPNRWFHSLPTLRKPNPKRLSS